MDAVWVTALLAPAALRVSFFVPVVPALNAPLTLMLACESSDTSPVASTVVTAAPTAMLPPVVVSPMSSLPAVMTFSSP